MIEEALPLTTESDHSDSPAPRRAASKANEKPTRPSSISRSTSSATSTRKSRLGNTDATVDATQLYLKEIGYTPY